MNKQQIAVVRTMFELACARIDQLYIKPSAEEEKQALERWIKAAFPLGYDEIIRSETQHYKEETDNGTV